MRISGPRDGAQGCGGIGCAATAVAEERLARQGEAQRAFGNSSVFLERYVERAKHIEVQILGDKQGNVVHLHERDCAVQRRHQKVVEIAPSIGLPDQVREDLCNAAVQIASSIGIYRKTTLIAI